MDYIQPNDSSLPVEPSPAAASSSTSAKVAPQIHPADHDLIVSQTTTRTTQVIKFLSRESSPSGVLVTAKMRERFENPPDWLSIADYFDQSIEERIDWSEYKKIPGAKEATGEDWTLIEEDAFKWLMESITPRERPSWWRFLFYCFSA